MSEYASFLQDTIASVERRCSRQRQLAYVLREKADLQSRVLDALDILENHLFQLTIAYDKAVRLL